MKALLLAGGRGSRLLPYTTTVPKPLIPIGDIPIMELLLRQLAARGIRDVFVAVGYLGHLVEGFFQNGERLEMSIHYLRESEPLGTAGPIATALPELGEDFLVLNGDLLTTLDFSSLIAFHREMKADATIAVCEREIQSEFGEIELGPDQRLIDYREKPTHTSMVSMGCYVFRSQAVAPLLKTGQHLDMPDLILRLRDRGANIRCQTQPCHWFDIGRPEDHRLANEWFESARDEFLSLK